MQMRGSTYTSVFNCARTVYRAEGLSAFYVSYPTTLLMTIPFTAVQFSTYEYFKKVLNPQNTYSPVTHALAGGIAGGLAAASTTPLDVAKTLLQTRGTSADPQIRNARGMIDAFKIIWAKDGLRGFSRGLTPRVLTHMPSNALCWLSYEFFSEQGSTRPIPWKLLTCSLLISRGCDWRTVIVDRSVIMSIIYLIISRFLVIAIRAYLSSELLEITAWLDACNFLTC